VIAGMAHEEQVSYEQQRARDLVEHALVDAQTSPPRAASAAAPANKPNAQSECEGAPGLNKSFGTFWLLGPWL
jgi:hypothetical protein